MNARECRICQDRTDGQKQTGVRLTAQPNTTTASIVSGRRDEGGVDASVLESARSGRLLLSHDPRRDVRRPVSPLPQQLMTAIRNLACEGTATDSCWSTVLPSHPKVINSIANIASQGRQRRIFLALVLSAVRSSTARRIVGLTGHSTDIDHMPSDACPDGRMLPAGQEAVHPQHRSRTRNANEVAVLVTDGILDRP